MVRTSGSPEIFLKSWLFWKQNNLLLKITFPFISGDFRAKKNFEPHNFHQSQKFLKMQENFAPGPVHEGNLRILSSNKKCTVYLIIRNSYCTKLLLQIETDTFCDSILNPTNIHSGHVKTIKMCSYTVKRNLAT